MDNAQQAFAAEMLDFATAQKGQGWHGAMEILDVMVGCPQLPLGHVAEIKSMMHQEFAQQILSGELGCDERAMTTACNLAIESAIQVLKDRIGNLSLSTSQQSSIGCDFY